MTFQLVLTHAGHSANEAISLYFTEFKKNNYNGFSNFTALTTECKRICSLDYGRDVVLIFVHCQFANMNLCVTDKPNYYRSVS